jgi:FKBP-type peptidyl-prolyl cis-trans isomerase
LATTSKGWTEGIPYFKEGEWDSLVPAHLGYGSNGRGSIPGVYAYFDISN